MATTAAAPIDPPSELRHELLRHAPFAQMEPGHVAWFVDQAQTARFAAGERVLEPEQGPVTHLLCIGRGKVSGHSGVAEAVGGFEYEAGDLFPVGAVMAERAVTARYHATEDVLLLRLALPQVKQLAALSAPFADFLSRRVLHFLELSQRSVQLAYASRTVAEQSLETPLGQLIGKPAITVAPDTALREALQQMHRHRIGSVVVVDAQGAPLGMVTRHDVIGRVTLGQMPLVTPISQAMTAPVLSLTVNDRGQDAALLMSRHGVRHVAVTDGGRLVGVVSERDLFAMQRLSLKQVSGAIRSARDVATLSAVARDIRSLARNLLGQGVGARQLTELISHLNDVLTAQLVQMLASERGLDLGQACWLAFGSEGRCEQTVATDQDNGLVFVSEQPERDRPRWLDFAAAVNRALDACGFPFCKGQVMASNADCCLTSDEWCRRFTGWIEQGAPADLLKASIYFDFRPLVGRFELADPMRRLVSVRAAQMPRFIKQLAGNALRSGPPLNWHGGIAATVIDGRSMVDLKLGGTAVFVDAARIYALALGIAETSTRRRLEEAGRLLGVQANESQGWIGGFEFLQLLRLQVQIEREGQGAPVGVSANLIELATLNDIERRTLRETFRLARRLQQRLALDYQR